MQVSVTTTVEPICQASVSQPPLLAVPPQLDIVTCDAFLAICHCCLNTRPHGLILDFSQTHFIDSCGIGTLARVVRAARALDASVTAWSVHPLVAETLRTAELDRAIFLDDRTRDVKTPDCFPSRRASFRLLHPSTRSLAKRALDMLGAVAGLSLTALLFVPIAIAIQIDDPGPILFSQVRRGWRGRPFRIWKFRSMVANAEARKSEVTNQIEGAFFKNDRDPHITRVGQFLRRTSLDELPQFWCVLRGTMSLIGTRPPTEDEVEQYAIADWRRLNVKPGLSGEWQVSGRSSIKTFSEVVALDLAYQRKWSVIYDLKLIAKTIATVLSRRSEAC